MPSVFFFLHSGSFSNIWIGIYPASSLLLQVHILYRTHQHLSCSVFLFERFIRLKKGCYALLDVSWCLPWLHLPIVRVALRQTLLRRPLLHLRSLLGFLFVHWLSSLFTACSSSHSLPALSTNRSFFFSMCSYFDRTRTLKSANWRVVVKLRLTSFLCPSIVLPSSSRQWALTGSLASHDLV